MGVDIGWYDDRQTLLQVTLASPWDWLEFEQVMYQGLEKIAPVGHPVHFLIDFADQGSRPKGNSLIHLKRVMQHAGAQPNAGINFLINPNPFARSLIDMLLRVYGGAERLRMVDSQEEALSRINALIQTETGEA